MQEAQRFLERAFMRPEPVVDDAALSAECARFVRGNERLTPAEQVDIYRRQFWLRHDGSLADDFPGVKHLVGDDAWEAIVRAYLAAHPPHTPSLRDLGAELQAFLDAYPLDPSIAVIARDMVRYELAFIDVFDGALPPPLDATRIASLSPEAWQVAMLELSPLVRRMRFDFPVHELRLAVRSRAEGDPPPPLPAARPVRLALFRRDDVVHFEELDPTAFALLDALAGGASLVAACGAVAETLSPEEATALGPKVGEWFRRWAAWGFIAEVVVP
jgi:hypothetical protein